MQELILDCSVVCRVDKASKKKINPATPQQCSEASAYWDTKNFKQSWRKHMVYMDGKSCGSFDFTKEKSKCSSS